MPPVMLVRPLRKQVSYVKDEVSKKSGSKPPLSSPSKEGGREGGITRPACEGKEVEVILDLVKVLTPTLRKELLARIVLLDQALPSGQLRDQDMWAHAVQEALSNALMGTGVGSGGVMAVKRFTSASSAWSPVTRFMEATKYDQLTVTQRQAVYVMLAKMLVENCLQVSRKIGIPLSAKLVANNAGNIAGVFNQSFPGYVEAGLAMMVARRLTGGSTI